MDQSHLEWLENHSSKLRHMHLAKEAIEIAVEQPQCTPTAERLSVSVQNYLCPVIGNVMPPARIAIKTVVQSCRSPEH